MERFYPAREAAELLGISMATLYAYVSRGLIRSEAAPGERRARRYRAEDVDRLVERQRLRYDPSRAAREALRWGEPVLESRISSIESGRLFYRGRDATELARTASVEEVAALLWRGGDDARAEREAVAFDSDVAMLPRAWTTVARALAQVSPIERGQIALPLAEHDDRTAYDLRAPAVESAGVRIVRTLLAAMTGADRCDGGLARALGAAWGVTRRRDVGLLSAAVIAAADHELNVSTFTVRCVASAGSTPYAAVSAGLGALRGTRHGGYTERVTRLVEEVEREGSAERVVQARLRQGEAIPGFGHPLYPDGDPRGALLLELATSLPATTRALRPLAGLVEQVARSGGEAATIDLGLVAVARALRLPVDAPIILFALGRTLGWIGHAIEQYASGQLIRPRARYTGERPTSADASAPS